MFTRTRYTRSKNRGVLRVVHASVFVFAILAFMFLNASFPHWNPRMDMGARPLAATGRNETLKTPSIIYFVISHPSCIETEKAARATWARNIKATWARNVNLIWFSTEATFPDTVVVSVEPNTYMNIFPRVLKVWAKVYMRQRYDWYIRIWPDNYVFSERLERLLAKYDPSVPQVIGRLHTNQNGETYVSGGAGWAVSRAALEAWDVHHGPSFENCRKPHWLEENLEFAEDVIISNCLNSSGVKLVERRDVFLSHYPGHEDNNDLTAQEAADGIPVPIVTLHYMTANMMLDVWNKEKNDKIIRRIFGLLTTSILG